MYFVLTIKNLLLTLFWQFSTIKPLIIHNKKLFTETRRYRQKHYLCLVSHINEKPFSVER